MIWSITSKKEIYESKKNYMEAGCKVYGDLARCLLLTENMSYIDALKAVIASAS